MAKTYDHECFNLAWDYIRDHQNGKGYRNHQEAENLSHQLALKVQEAIDDFLEDLSKQQSKPPCVRRIDGWCSVCQPTHNADSSFA